MKVYLSEYAGFCFGVKRADELMQALLDTASEGTIYTYGELIHNRDYNADLKKRGVRLLTAEGIDALPPGAVVVLRTHGVAVGEIEKIRAKGARIEDATCPFVRRLHDILDTEKLRPNTQFLIFGDASHPEIIALLSHAPVGTARVIASESDIPMPRESGTRTVLLAQTTANHDLFCTLSEIVKKRFSDVTVYDTVCASTNQRGQDAAEIAQRVDLMLVIGAKNSSNTQKLADISARHCKTILVENASELEKGPICSAETVGITAGASTPRRIIEEVISFMTDKTQEENLSFAELLEQSFKTISPGEVATGTITRILPAEIHVDLGIKHTGILAQEEVSDDSSFDLTEHFNLGDEITVLVQKFNDAEGTVQVSKKKLDNRAGWQKIVEAHDADAVLSGTVTAAIKGGILVSWEGQSIFIPGSLSGLPKEADLHRMVGQTVQFKFAELDEQKRRTVGSIRAAQREQRKALADAFWQELKPGDVYTGTVKSITSFGAFVDLGGADGMVHITELSWKRLSHPSEVVSLGQEVTVYVKDVNYDTHKISLGYKKEEDNPWTAFAEKFKVGDVTKVTIVNMTPFGAFAEIIPGVDGLIHISQITNKHLTKPQDILTIGEVVEAEIIDINAETKKISLSMRALLPAEEQDAADVTEAPEISEKAAELAVEAAAAAEAEKIEEKVDKALETAVALEVEKAESLAEIPAEEAAPKAEKEAPVKKTRAPKKTAEDAEAPTKKAVPKKKAKENETPAAEEKAEKPAPKKKAAAKKTADKEEAIAE